jgi:inward rectifier potassium channel
MTFRRKGKTKHELNRSIWRIEHKDGRNQIVGLNVWYSFWGDPYHLLLTVPWSLLVGILAVLYIAINSGFAGLYLLVPNSIGGIDSPSFADAFFFSVQTFASIGYGVMHPQNLYTNIITTIEAFASLFAIALVTGLIFARFTKSTARVLFSKVAIVKIHNGIQTLMFRAANERRNQILEANLRVVLMRDEISEEGEFMRRFHELKLERNYSPSFTLSWTAIHNIDRDSPLYGCTAESLAQVNAQIIVSLSGIDETIANAIHSRHTYTAADILFDRRFVDILSRTTEGHSYIDYTRFHDTELISLVS